MASYAFNFKFRCRKINIIVSTSFALRDVDTDEHFSRFIPMYNLSSLLFNEKDVSNEPSIFLSGFNENQLEMLDSIVFNVTRKSINTIILNEDLKNKKLKEMVKESFLLKYDHVLPDREYITPNPFILFHSLNEFEIRELIKNFRLLLHDVVFAVVVKNSLEKKICTLIDEIFEDNRNKKKV